jgi:hypothetical protein
MKRKIIIWIIGFAVLLIIDLLVERLLLPAIGLDKTEKNDLYFKLWWVLVAIWLIFGLPVLGYIERHKKKP